MKSNELRIGNIIQYMGKQVTVDSTIIFEVDSNNATGQPIPLTEEWLKKFGFRKYGKYDHKLKINGFTLCTSNKFFLGKGFIFIFELLDLDLEIKHVHSLQNLVFTLTGKELTI